MAVYIGYSVEFLKRKVSSVQFVILFHVASGTLKRPTLSYHHTNTRYDMTDSEGKKKKTKTHWYRTSAIEDPTWCWVEVCINL